LVGAAATVLDFISASGRVVEAAIEIKRVWIDVIEPRQRMYRFK
jgi:hypothetical protein